MLFFVFYVRSMRRFQKNEDLEVATKPGIAQVHPRPAPVCYGCWPDQLHIASEAESTALNTPRQQAWAHVTEIFCHAAHAVERKIERGIDRVIWLVVKQETRTRHQGPLAENYQNASL